MLWPLKDKTPKLPEINSVGDFGFKRSFYYHPGIDLYCPLGQEIQAIEDGVVVHIENFTGPNAEPPSPWWLDTQSILVEGASGVLGYCELEPLPHIKIGYKVSEGEIIGKILQVIKEDLGNGTTMLHFEQYISGTTSHAEWLLNEGKENPKGLINPRSLLEKLIK